MAGKIQHIWCSSSLFKKFEDVFISFVLTQAQQTEIDEYIVYLTTGGGSPFTGINLYNFLKSLPQKTTAYNMGSIDSAGVEFFLGFEHRLGVPDCSFMIHQTMLPRSALPELFTFFNIQTEGEKLAATDRKTHAIIARETKPHATHPLSEEEIYKAALKTTTFHAEDSQKHGFIQGIERPTLPKEGIFYITEQYLATLPD